MQGKKNWAIVDYTDREQIQPLLCIGLFYHISNFRVAPTTTTSRSVDTDRMIILTKKTTIADLHQACGIDRFKYDFYSTQMIVSGIGHATTVGGIRTCALDLVYSAYLSHPNNELIAAKNLGLMHSIFVSYRCMWCNYKCGKRRVRN